jgi:hypothetical protein
MTGLRECGKYRYFQGCMASMMTAFAGEDVVEGLTDLAGLMHYRSLADVTVARCQRRLSTDPVACLDAASVRNQVHGLVWSTLGRWLEEGAPAESISARVETWDTDEGIASLVDSALTPTPSAGAASP